MSVEDHVASNDESVSSRTAVGSCEYCEHGTLWEDPSTNELVCDACHVSLDDSAQTQRLVPRRQARDRKERQSHEWDEYVISGKTRMNGGYKRGYLSWRTGPEYAIDLYVDEGELCTPRDRYGDY